MVCNVLVGTKTEFIGWKKCIDKINEDNIFFIDLTENIDVLEEIVEKNKIEYIIPLCHEEYELLTTHNLASMIIGLDDITHNMLYNKVKFCEYMMENFEENIPKTYELNGKQFVDTIRLPAVVKPNILFAGKGVVICKHMNKLRKCRQKKVDIIQEFIYDTYEYSANMFCVSGVIINYKIIKQKYNMFNVKTSLFQLNECEYVDDFDMTFFKQIMSELNYSGGCCVDFKMQNGVIKIFEMNPRFGGSVFTLDVFKDLITF